MRSPEFHIFALASHGNGISGGDRIWIELARRWSKNLLIFVETWKEGFEMAERQKLYPTKNLHFTQYKIPLGSSAFSISYVMRILVGIKVGLTTKMRTDPTYLYSASEFWMDVFPCVLLKIRYPKLKWVATWYQTAPNPLVGFSEIKRTGSSYKLTSFIYWLVQLPIKPLIKQYADFVIVNNQEEKKQFPSLTKKNKTIVLIGAVSLDNINGYLRKHPKPQKIYDAVFQGRFHPQKGVLELVKIWRNVVDKLPQAQLVMIGDGPLMSSVRTEIEKLGLLKNIHLQGFVFDGEKKYSLFSKSKVVVHPAYYDSGGMATAEAMAFGIPAVGFDLKAYKSYYPSGMIYAKNEEDFSNAIVSLLVNERKRKSIGIKARSLITASYSWDTRAQEVWSHIS